MSETKQGKMKPWVYWALFTGTLVVVFLIGMLAASIMERRAETVARVELVRDLGEYEPRNEIWGENFPKQYESYRRTLDTNFRSPYGGSGFIDYLEMYPELVVMWAGHGFSRDYNQGRGHGHAINDLREILRTGGIEFSPQPSTCWTCKSTDVPRIMNKMGVAEFYKGKWTDLGAEVVNPIGCQDCHDPKTMNLRITRPALTEAFQRRGKDITKATHQEMRSLVCAQCHVEYYFDKKNDNYLVFPWDNGFSAEDMERYYDEADFYDWINPLSRAKMIKAQHPDYEVYMTGVHAERGVACADCHLPYKVEGGVKFTDHHMQSPLNNIANSCQVCHRESEEQLKKDVVSRQQKVMEIRRIAEKAIARTHLEAQKAWEAGATETEMEPILKLIRNAQWRWDYVAATNGTGFHSPVESLRVLGTSIQLAEKASGMLNVVFVRKGVPIPVQLPDVSTKEKAQKYIGLDMEKARKDKEDFLNTIVPEWDRQAKARQGTLIKY